MKVCCFLKELENATSFGKNCRSCWVITFEKVRDYFFHRMFPHSLYVFETWKHRINRNKIDSSIVICIQVDPKPDILKQMELFLFVCCNIDYREYNSLQNYNSLHFPAVSLEIPYSDCFLSAQSQWGRRQQIHLKDDRIIYIKGLWHYVT